MSQNTPQYRGAGRIALGLVAALALQAQHASAATVTVQSGQLIQSALNAASPGDTIRVRAGTYNELLIISKDRISLIGNNAILMPPASAKASNACSNLINPAKQVGICVRGQGLSATVAAGAEHNTVTQTQAGSQVKNVTVSGFTVSGFAGVNVAVVGAKDTTITNNKLVDGGVFGVLSITSVNTMATSNDISSSTLGTTGMGMADTAASSFLKNNITGYATGVRIETSAGYVQESIIKNCCMGITINPAVAGAVVSSNYIGTVNPVCSLSPNSANPAGGILVNGGVKSRVTANSAIGLHRAGNAAGITITDDKTSPAMSVASENKFTLNVLINDDVSIKKDTTGSGNTYVFNS